MSWLLTLVFLFARVVPFPQMDVKFPGPIAPSAVVSRITLVAHGNCNGNGCTTSALNTTGATLLVITGAQGYGPTTVTAPTDSKGNTWQTAINASSGCNRPVAIFYAYNPTVGTNHTFSAGTSSGGSNLTVSAWSGTAISSSVFQTGLESSCGNGTSVQPGSITPSATGYLLITVSFTGQAQYPVAISSGFSLLDATVYGPDAYLIDTSSNPINPTWSWSGNNYATAAMAAFAHP
jgi:hypothetical protein